MKTILSINNRRVGEGCFRVYGGKLYYYATRFNGFNDSDYSDIVRYEIKEDMAEWDYKLIIRGDEANQNVMDVSICDNKLFYLRKNSLKDCQIRYYEMDGIDIIGESHLVKDGGYYPMINDSVRITSNGRILCPTAIHPFNDKFMHSSVCVIYSDDHGKTWNSSNILKNRFISLQEPVVEELSEDRLIMFMRTKTGWLYAAISWDNGKTWGKPNRYCRSPHTSVCIKRIEENFYMAGNQLFAPIDGITIGDKRTPLSITKFNSEFVYKDNTPLEHSLFGCYCYPSICKFKSRFYAAYYTGYEMFKSFTIVKI